MVESVYCAVRSVTSIAARRAAIDVTYVTWQGNEGELPEDDTIVPKHVEA